MYFHPCKCTTYITHTYIFKYIYNFIKLLVRTYTCKSSSGILKANNIIYKYIFTYGEQELYICTHE